MTQTEANGTPSSEPSWGKALGDLAEGLGEDVPKVGACLGGCARGGCITLVVIVVAIVAIVGATSGGGGSSSTQEKPPPPPPSHWTSNQLHEFATRAMQAYAQEGGSQVGENPIGAAGCNEVTHEEFSCIVQFTGAGGEGAVYRKVTFQMGESGAWKGNF